MTPSTPTLSAQVATLRLAVPSGTAGENRGLYNYLIEMIFACLNRLFTRLKQVVQLWQDGAHPIANPAQRESARQTRGPSVPRRRYPRSRTARRFTQSTPNPDRAIPAARPALRPAHHLKGSPRPPIRATHDPPPPRLSKTTILGGALARPYCSDIKIKCLT